MLKYTLDVFMAIVNNNHQKSWCFNMQVLAVGKTSEGHLN